jgi:hypothetical protein
MVRHHGAKMFLSHAELVALTGYKRPNHIVRWLESRAWHFERTGFGWPVVSKAYAEAKLSGVVTPATKVGPNLGSVR